MPFTRFASSILQSNQDVVASDLTVDSQTVTVNTVENRLGVNTDEPLGTIGVDGDLYFQPTAISTSHVYTAGSLDIRATDNIKLGTDDADSVRIGRTNTTAAKVHIRSGADTDLVVSNSKVGIGTDAPDHTLSVAGDIDLSGGLSFDGGTAVTSIDTDLSSVSGAHDTLVTAKAAKAYADSVGGGGTSDLSDVTGTLAVANGGTGATTLTDGGILLGSGTGAISASAVLGNGELLIGDASGDPAVGTLTAGDGIDITNGSGSITIAAEESSASNLGVVTVAGGTDCTVTYSSGTATVAVDDLAAAKITSGTFADARIASSSVVQHQADITGSGALNSGTITSGFGAIDNGASGYTTTGAATVGTVLATQDNNGETLPIVVKNADDTADADAAVGYGFDLETTAGATVNSAKIVAKKKESFTATASTQDAKLEFYVTKNGTEAKQFTLQGGNELRFSNSNSSLTVADSSGDNQAGKNIVIEAGAGTGSGVPGKFEVKVSAPTGTAADVQTHNSAIVADGNGVSIYTGASLSGLANDTGFGEIIYWGTEDGTDSLAAGRLMSLNTSGVWKYADADAVATTNTLLAIALGSAVSDGLLVKGYFKLNSYIEGSFAKGAPCFVSEASGEIDFTAPSAAGDVLRIVGHGTSETNVILFDPSNDYVEL